MKNGLAGYEKVLNPFIALAVGLTMTACRGERPTSVPQPTPGSTPTIPWKTPTPLPHAPTVAIPTRTPEPTRTPTPTPTAIPESQYMETLVNVSSELAERCVTPGDDTVYATVLDIVNIHIGDTPIEDVHVPTYARVRAVIPDTDEVVVELSIDGDNSEAYIIPPGATIYATEPLYAEVDGIVYTTEYKYGLFTYTGYDEKKGTACFVSAPIEPDDYIQPPQDGAPETPPQQLPASTYQL